MLEMKGFYAYLDESLDNAIKFSPEMGQSPCF